MMGFRLNNVNGSAANQLFESGKIMLMLTRCNRNDFLVPKLGVGRTVIQGKRFFQPSYATGAIARARESIVAEE